MTYGIEIRNQHDTVLIDDTYKNWAVRSKQVYVNGALSSQVGTPAAVGLWAFRRTALGATSYTRWQFADPVATSDAWGVRIYNASGQVVFDSGRQYARVVGVFAGPADGATVTQTYPAGRTYAVITSKGAGQLQYEYQPDPNSPPGWYVRRSRFRGPQAWVSGGTVTVQWTILSDWGPWSELPTQNQTPPPGADPASQFIVLDVTGY